MKIIDITKENILTGTTVLFGALALIGTAAVLIGVPASRSLMLATLACLLLCFVCLSLLARRHMLLRYHVRIKREHTTINFKPGNSDKPAEIGRAQGRIHVETRFQSLREDLQALKIQKFISEPTAINSVGLLNEWGYAGRISTRQGGASIVQPAPQISDSRSFDLIFNLPEPMAMGDIFTLTEDFSFFTDLSQPGATYVFLVRDPTRERLIDILFEGLRPENAEITINNGHGEFTTLALDVEETGPGAWRIPYRWKRPSVGEELRLSWNWAVEVVEAARADLRSVSSTRTILSAAADASQPSIGFAQDMPGGAGAAKIVATTADGQPLEEGEEQIYSRMTETIDTQGQGQQSQPQQPQSQPQQPVSVSNDEQPAGALADDHPIIQAARARIKAKYNRDS
ncbi:MAG: hypothetical protein HOL06_05510 [Rhodospirillaceae bacterium]|nr:hypothetical protein [Rhodospirillaceae bacterium]